MLRRLRHETQGSTAAEFALILPIFLLFLLGIMDAGRYAWAFNRAEKATQIGARWAVATQIIPGGTSSTGLLNYSFAVSGGVPQGTVVDQTKFPGVSCQQSGTDLTTVACTCKGTCGFTYQIDADAQTAWNNLVARMQDIYPDITGANISIDYDWSGLGFAGDPHGADVAPLVTVSLRNVTFQPMTLYIFQQPIPVPSASYTLTMEDGQGAASN
ncbi:TadE/TadG family type IV pilus assembly protein [Novosphingobium malaysiense]|uniref:Pilus assembly protein TadE n=1 Tax=Novosphingobium malaysiense TaxID=1348853 RepID=A0A0B1ZP16_9SPHN|nr:TadE/TadG family type IV pilus assembly protein [Novosphingobium malaysiense]KHK92326.1 pilus assembly protein TadE [Novosphingobium malaysiense]